MQATFAILVDNAGIGFGSYWRAHNFDKLDLRCIV